MTDKKEKTHLERLKLGDVLYDALMFFSKCHGIPAVQIIRKSIFWWNKHEGKFAPVVYSKNYKDTTKSKKPEGNVLHPNISLDTIPNKSAADLRYILTMYLCEKWKIPAPATINRPKAERGVDYVLDGDEVLSMGVLQ